MGALTAPHPRTQVQRGLGGGREGVRCSPSTSFSVKMNYHYKDISLSTKGP